jgi:hypothetical protein
MNHGAIFRAVMNLDRFAFTSHGVTVMSDVIPERIEAGVEGERARRESGFFVAGPPELIAGRDDDGGTPQRVFRLRILSTMPTEVAAALRRRG